VHSTGDVRLFPGDYSSVMHPSSKKGRGWDCVEASAGLSEDLVTTLLTTTTTTSMLHVNVQALDHTWCAISRISRRVSSIAVVTTVVIRHIGLEQPNDANQKSLAVAQLQLPSLDNPSTYSSCRGTFDGRLSHVFIPASDTPITWIRAASKQCKL